MCVHFYSAQKVKYFQAGKLQVCSFASRIFASGIFASGIFSSQTFVSRTFTGQLS
jgi:hypothetical protein